VEIGAVNTVVVRRDGSLFGSNTDYLGVLRAPRRNSASGQPRPDLRRGWRSSRSYFALTRAGAAVAICARREKAAKELARAFGAEVVPRAALRTESFDAILNATPVACIRTMAFPHLRPTNYIAGS